VSPDEQDLVRPLVVIDAERDARVDRERLELRCLRRRANDDLTAGPLKPHRHDPGAAVHPVISELRRVDRLKKRCGDRVVEQFNAALLCHLSPFPLGIG
jgi:hypothetical protein